MAVDEYRLSQNDGCFSLTCYRVVEHENIFAGDCLAVVMIKCSQPIQLKSFSLQLLAMVNFWSYFKRVNLGPFFSQI